jgi:ATPase subunit of ABC transporter with duplicated ATPase domains
VLLNKTPFFLERGHCYGLVGQNGVGKTTLLTRVAAGDINNFPKDVSCYYIQHEILAEAGTGVLTFMLGQVRSIADAEHVRVLIRKAAFRCRRDVARTASLRHSLLWGSPRNGKRLLSASCPVAGA